MKLQFSQLLSYFCVACCLAAASSLASAAPAHPHVIMIYTDDMGYGDISSFATTPLQCRTPNIDRLASQGMKFTRFYVSMPICSPSRAAVLSGRFSPRNRMTNYLEFRDSNNAADQNDWMDPANAFLPKAFQSAGYATGHIGKWHLGGGRDVDNPPSIRLYGYDEAYSTWESPNPDPGLGIKFTPWDYNNLEPGQVPRYRRTEYMVNKTLDFLQRHPEQPCFITMWPDDVHTPFFPSPEMQSKWGGAKGADSGEKNFYAVLEEYDRQIGRLIDGIDAMGLGGDTIVFFTGDNGPSPDLNDRRSNMWKGKKLSLFEGGIREPFIIRWTGHIPAGVTNSTTVMSIVDLLPTLTTLAGVPLSPEAANGMDGEDVSAAMLGGSHIRTKPIFWEYGRTSQVPRPGTSTNDYSPVLAMQENNYKLLMDPDGSNKMLFLIQQDPGEVNNMASAYPAVVADMSNRLLAWRNQLPHRDQPYPAFASVDFLQYGVSQLASGAEAQLAAGAASTRRLAGVAAAPNGDDFIYAIHEDNTGNASFLRISNQGDPVKLTDSASVAADLNATGTAVTLTGGFEYSPGGDRVLFGDTTTGSPGQVTLVSVDSGTHKARQIARSSSLSGLADLSMMPDGTVAAVRGAAGNKTVGIVQTSNGAWIQKITEAQLLTASAGSTSLPPLTIGVNSSTGFAYVFADGDRELFDVSSLSGTPTITKDAQAYFSSLNLQDITVDQANNMYAYDAASNQIVILKAGGANIYAISLVALGNRLGQAVQVDAATAGRQIAARMIDNKHSDLFLLNNAPSNQGIVRIRFGQQAAVVNDWELY